MGLLAPLASLLGTELERAVDRAKSAALVYGLIAICLLIAAAFLLAASFMGLAQIVGPLVSALILAGSFLVLALAVYLGSVVSQKRRQRERAERRKAQETTTLLTTAAITAIPLLTKSPALVRLGLPAAAIAAFALLGDHKED